MQLRWQIAQFFEIRWWQHYLCGKDKNRYLDWKKNYWKALVDRLGLQVEPDVSVLDAGCGPAGIFTILPNNRVDAVDPLLDRYERDLSHFRKSEYLNVRFFSETIEDFQPAQTYDYVFCLNAINHVSDLNFSLDRLTACTRPGGTLVLSVDAHNYGWLKRIFTWIPGDVLHPHQYDLTEYQDMLTRRGWRIEQTVLLKKERIFSYYVMVARSMNFF